MLLAGLSILSSSAFCGTLVQFRTTVGDLEVELLDREKPVTVQNFLRYVTNGLYTNSFFHRGVSNFVIQGGGFRVGNRTNLTNFTVTPVATFPPITNEFKVGPFYSNLYGTIAMAKTADPNSATSQFFFNLTNNSSSLDNTNNSGGFTVFGRVVGGTNVLNQLNAAHPTAAIRLVNAGGAFSELPVVRTFSGASLESDELVYFDVTVLSVRISLLPDGAREISWNSISNRVNHVEYTTNFPAIWHPLVATNGNGGPIEVSDNTAENSRRFYRVRIAY